ncbi:MAG: hypothetical protein ACM3SV_13535 [Betaproteobacteria bacterium]
MNLTPRNIALRIPEGKLGARLYRSESARLLGIVACTGQPPAADAVTNVLLQHGHAVLTIDLLTPDEAHFIRSEGNAPLLAQRLIRLLDFIRDDGDTAHLALGIFARGHAAPAAIRAAAQRDVAVRAVVANGGLIDHAGLEYLEALVAPLLVLCDEGDPSAEIAARRAVAHIGAPWEIRTINEGSAASQVTAWFEHWIDLRS